VTLATPVSDPAKASRWIPAIGPHGPRSRRAGRAVHQGISPRRSLPFHPKAPRLFRQGPFEPARTRAGCSMPVRVFLRSVSCERGDQSSLCGARQQGLLWRAVLFSDRRCRESKRGHKQHDARTNETEKYSLHDEPTSGRAGSSWECVRKPKPISGSSSECVCGWGYRQTASARNLAMPLEASRNWDSRAVRPRSMTAVILRTPPFTLSIVP
jgi:hypothetical protein